MGFKIPLNLPFGKLRAGSLQKGEGCYYKGKVSYNAILLSGVEEGVRQIYP
jgi:hypothetical protein